MIFSETDCSLAPSWSARTPKSPKNLSNPFGRIFAPVEEAIGRITEPHPVRRLGLLVDLMTDSVFSNEALMRTALRVYMGQWIEARHRGQPPPVVRVGRRMTFMDRILEAPRKKCSKARWRHLRAALALTMGPEAMVTMKDVCRLSDREAKSVLQWAAQALLAAGLKEMEP